MKEPLKSLSSPMIQRLLSYIDEGMREELIEDIYRLRDLNCEIAALCRIQDDLDTIGYVNSLMDEREALRAKWDGIAPIEKE